MKKNKILTFLLSSILGVQSGFSNAYAISQDVDSNDSSKDVESENVDNNLTKPPNRNWKNFFIPTGVLSVVFGSYLVYKTKSKPNNSDKKKNPDPIPKNTKESPESPKSPKSPELQKTVNPNLILPCDDCQLYVANHEKDSSLVGKDYEYIQCDSDNGLFQNIPVYSHDGTNCAVHAALYHLFDPGLLDSYKDHKDLKNASGYDLVKDITQLSRFFCEQNEHIKNNPKEVIQIGTLEDIYKRLVPSGRYKGKELQCPNTLMDIFTDFTPSNFYDAEYPVSCVCCLQSRGGCHVECCQPKYILKKNGELEQAYVLELNCRGRMNHVLYKIDWEDFQKLGTFSDCRFATKKEILESKDFYCVDEKKLENLEFKKLKIK